MKKIVIILCFMLGGCAVNINTQTFIYQDDELETAVDVDVVMSKLTNKQQLLTITKTSVATSDGLTLQGIKLSHQQATANLVLFGGNGMKISNAAEILNHFALLPVNVIWFDYRGTGISEKSESLSITQLKADALVVFDYAKQQFPTKSPILLHGLSMGSLIATYVASQREIDGLILDGAINSVPKLIDQLVPGWSKPFYNINISPELAQIDNAEILKQYSNPLLLLVGEDDETTPLVFSQQLLAISPSENKSLAIIPDSDHSQNMKHQQAIQSYQAFITGIKQP